MSENNKSRRFSLILWISGGLLWVIVGALFVVGALRDDEPARAAGDQAGGVDVLFLPGSAVDGGGLVEPKPIWDPEGINDFSLTERSGKTVTQDDLLGKPWIIGFIFTRCAGPCPKVSGQMSILQDKLEDEKIRLVTWTVDPDYDTPKVLRRYAKAFGAKEGWLFLTGDKKKMYPYIKENFKMPVQEMTGKDRVPGFQVLHTTNLLLIDAKGVVQGAYNALDPAEMAALIKDARDLAEDKPAAEEE